MGILSWVRAHLATPNERPIRQPARDLQAETQQARKLWRRAVRSGDSHRASRTARQLRKLKREARGF